MGGMTSAKGRKKLDLTHIMDTTMEATVHGVIVDTDGEDTGVDTDTHIGDNCSNYFPPFQLKTRSSITCFTKNLHTVVWTCTFTLFAGLKSSDLNVIPKLSNFDRSDK